MKKLLICFIVLLISTFAFAKPKEKFVFENGNQLLTEFWNKGNVLKIINSTDINSTTTTYYINKYNITSLKFKADEIEVAVNGYNLDSSKSEDSEDYSASYWIMELDENYNLILRKRAD